METNYKELLKLKDMYESISLKQLREEWRDGGRNTMGNITGFGDADACILCQPVDMDCIKCIYEKVLKCGCNQGVLRKSYDKIVYSETPEELMQAILHRIKDIKMVIEKYEKKKSKKTDNIFNIKKGDEYKMLIPILYWGGGINTYVWNGYKFDKHSRKHNNAFVSRKKAEYEQLKRRYEAKLREATEEAWDKYGEDLDWEKEEKQKWAIGYDYLEGRIKAKFTYYLAYFPIYYFFPTRESAHKFIDKNRELIEDFFTYWEEE